VPDHPLTVSAKVLPPGGQQRHYSCEQLYEGQDEDKQVPGKPGVGRIGERIGEPNAGADQHQRAQEEQVSCQAVNQGVGGPQSLDKLEGPCAHENNGAQVVDTREQRDHLMVILHLRNPRGIFEDDQVHRVEGQSLSECDGLEGHLVWVIEQGDGPVNDERRENPARSSPSHLKEGQQQGRLRTPGGLTCAEVISKEKEERWANTDFDADKVHFWFEAPTSTPLPPPRSKNMLYYLICMAALLKERTF